jgi:hypothetical protein
MRCNYENYTEYVFLESSRELGGFCYFEIWSFYCLNYHSWVVGLCRLFYRDISNLCRSIFGEETTCIYRIRECVCVGHRVMEWCWGEELNPSLADRIYVCDVCVWCQCADSIQVLKCVVEVLTGLLFCLATSDRHWGGKPRHLGRNKTANSDSRGGRRSCGAMTIVLVGNIGQRSSWSSYHARFVVLYGFRFQISAGILAALSEIL